MYVLSNIQDQIKISKSITLFVCMYFIICATSTTISYTHHLIVQEENEIQNTEVSEKENIIYSVCSDVHHSKYRVDIWSLGQTAI